MKILDAAQIRECDRFTIANKPIASIDLMERAADAITDWLTGNYIFCDTQFTIFAGSGNNGGDALAVHRCEDPGGALGDPRGPDGSGGLSCLRRLELRQRSHPLRRRRHPRLHRQTAVRGA